MKTAILFCLLALPALAQEPKQLTELQTAKIQLAVKDFQIAQIQATEAQRVMQDAQQRAQAQIAAIKKELGLDDSWDFDFQQGKFVKKPALAKK
jgi:hypothetical protein